MTSLEPAAATRPSGAATLGPPPAGGPGGGRALRLALVSEHASPLAALGGVDAGGQNVHVAKLAGALADRGHHVVVYTRRDDPELPERVALRPGVEVRHVPAGPAEQVPKDTLLPYMDDFGDWMARQWRTRPPDLVHSHYWMSGLAALRAVRAAGLPLVHTYHALGAVKRRHQGEADTSPAERVEREREVGLGCDRIVATCHDEVFELSMMRVPVEKAGIVPCGVDTEQFRPDGPSAPRTGGLPHRLVQLGRLVPRKGAAVALAAAGPAPPTRPPIGRGPPARPGGAPPGGRQTRP
ncbi:glycosyltransferase, partial [Streptomyces sp. ODS05-4]|uniref:glycosyltransferase n=1 Tax=Streptomyces sp. ODS05-4 TaxID=2944939 RepID=UPI00210BD136